MDLPIPSNLTKITAFLPDLEEIEVNDLITVLDWNLHFIQDLEDSLERFGQHRNLKKLTFFARDPHTPSPLVRTPLTEAIRGLMHVYPNLSDVRIVETYPLPSQALLDWIESMKKYRDQLKKYREDAEKARGKAKKIQADLKKPEKSGNLCDCHHPGQEQCQVGVLLFLRNYGNQPASAEVDIRSTKEMMIS